MPTYEYRCKDCGHTFDAYQSFTDDALTECPQCSGLLKKVFGNVGISFKGSGFYKTDSRSGAAPANGNGAKKDDASTSTSADSSSSSSSSSDGGSASSDTSASSTPKDGGTTKESSTTSSSSS